VLPGRTIGPETRVVTFVTRGLESMRGFDQFLRASRRILRERSDVLFVVVGNDKVYYGQDQAHTGQASFKQWVLSQGDYDLSRFVFFGHIEPARLAQILQLSDLHISWTVPFVPGWSLFNALSCGCVVLASDVEPVREIIAPAVNGLTVPFFDDEALAEAALRVLADPAAYRPLGVAGRRLMEEKYSLEVAVPELRAYFERMASTDSSVRANR
jgi:glycosyltransferase involved in cell wall biosynthesis